MCACMCMCEHVYVSVCVFNMMGHDKTLPLLDDSDYTLRHYLFNTSTG